MRSRPPAFERVEDVRIPGAGRGFPLLAGCAPQRVAFTQGSGPSTTLGARISKNLQYYLSSDITLQRDFRQEEREISTGHKLVTKEGGVVEEVLIRAGTPGIATEVGRNVPCREFRSPGRR